MTDRHAQPGTARGSDTATAVPDFDALDHQLAALAASDPLLVHPDELPEGLQRIQRATNVLATVRARWIAATEQRKSNGTERHSKWLSGQLGVDGDVAAKDAAVAKTVETHEPVAKAAEAGEISPDHVRVIGKAAGQVEDEQEAALVDELVAYAKDHTPEQTARLARKRAMQASPDRGQTTAQDQLAKRRFRFVERRDGMLHGEGLFTPEVGNKLKAALEPLTGPDNDVPEDQRRSYPQRLHDALGELADRAMATPNFPDSRGLPTHAMIIVDLPWLITDRGLDLDAYGVRMSSGPEPAITFEGEPISGETARRILCDADLSRIVTNGPSEILDVGRTTKAWPAPMRRAIYARDRGRCRRCGRPAQVAHHIRHWADGGPTCIDNGISLCLGCHLAVHEGGWAITLHPDNSVTFTAPNGQILERPPP
ncbi:MAG: DUF222 domain-containing protein [Actinobacteria bacterium]|nr:DUF222 domain-containing protein [Actinomycetota bacterium]